MSTGTKALKGPKAPKDQPLKDPHQIWKLNHGALENCEDLSGTAKRPKIGKKDVLVPMTSANGPENASAQRKKNRKKKKKK